MDYFHETQKMDQWWLKLILAAISILIMSIFSTALFENPIVEDGNSDQQTGDLAIVFVAGLAMGILALIIAIILNMKLELKISSGLLQYRYWPFVSNWKTIEKSEIIAWEVKKYSAIFEYGGWGYRLMGLKNRAYTTKGNRGLKIEMVNGHKKLFGTQMPEELTKAMSKLTEKNIVD